MSRTDSTSPTRPTRRTAFAGTIEKIEARTPPTATARSTDCAPSRCSPYRPGTGCSAASPWTVTAPSTTPVRSPPRWLRARELGAPDAGRLLPGGRVRLGALVPQEAVHDHRLAPAASGTAGQARPRGDGRLGGADPGAVRARGARGHSAYRVDAGHPAPVVRGGLHRGDRADAVLCARRPRDGRLGRRSPAGDRRRRRLPALWTVCRHHAVLAEHGERAAGPALRLSARGLLGRGQDRPARGTGPARRRLGPLRRAAARLPLPGVDGRRPRRDPYELASAVAAGPRPGRRPERRGDPAAGPDRTPADEARRVGAGRRRQPPRDDDPVLAPDGDARGRRARLLPRSGGGPDDRPRLPGLDRGPADLDAAVRHTARGHRAVRARISTGPGGPGRARRKPAARQRRGLLAAGFALFALGLA